MGQQTFDQFTCDPGSTPAVLETATWHKKNAIEQLKAVSNLFFQKLQKSINKAEPLLEQPLIQPYTASSAYDKAASWCIAELKDKQHVVLSVGLQDNMAFCDPFYRRQLGDKQCLYVYEADARQIQNFIHHIKPDKAPKASGAIPKLGIGCRMSTSVWPAA